tara:strand:+ start:4376 stop:4846 length:471 start_codon:yes stop_codon:yes gene_type:complete
MKQIISLILVFTLIFPAALYANPPESSEDPPPQPKAIGIQKGQLAPFSGVLLNALAAAQIFSEKNYSDEECKLKIDFEVKKEFTRMNLLLESTRASMDSMEKKYDSIISIKDTEIERLSKLASGQRDYSQWWATGGIVVGIVLTLTVVYGVKEITN